MQAELAAKVAQPPLERLRRYSPTVVLVLILALFVGASTFLALRLKTGVIPDENNHIQVSHIFAQTWGIPADSLQTIPYGMIHRWPFLFFWVSGRILNILNWAAPSLSADGQLLVFRFLGTLTSTAAVAFVYLGAGEILKNRWGRVFVTFLMTATMMYTLQSSGHTYDNVINLLSFASIYFLLRLCNGGAFWEHSLLVFALLCIGSLVKITMLPLAGLVAVVWLAFVLTHRKELSLATHRRVLMVGLGVLVLTAAAFNLEMYGLNLLRYKSLVPDCTQAFTQSECGLYPQYVRNRDNMLPQPIGTVQILSGQYPDIFEYAASSWSIHMLSSIYGILTHQGLLSPGSVFVSAYMLLIIVIVLVMVRYWQKPDFARAALCFLSVGYVLIVLFDGYSAELIFGFKHIGVQGRYVFPVIGALYTLMADAMLRIPDRLFKAALFELTVALFLSNSPIVFVVRFGSIMSAYMFR